MVGLRDGNPGSELLQIKYQLEEQQGRHNLPTRRHPRHFLCFCVSFVKFSYWFNFHVNTITSSWFMTIFVLGFGQKSRNRKYPLSEFFSINICWRLGRIRDAKFGMNVSSEKLLNLAKCQVYSLQDFWIIKGKPTGEVGVKTSPTQIRVKHIWLLSGYQALPTALTSTRFSLDISSWKTTFSQNTFGRLVLRRIKCNCRPKEVFIFFLHWQALETSINHWPFIVQRQRN